jgi:hypothetical protein
MLKLKPKQVEVLYDVLGWYKNDLAQSKEKSVFAT